MQVRIKATKIELSDEIKKYVEDKMNMLEKYLGDLVVTNCDVELEHSLINQTSGKIYRAEVNLAIPGGLLRVEKTE
ncbi:MAG: ribosome-associated translation inhibitor RaiA, partial [Clostridia bacterium]|nr:ribosome-associated translation inhibitor RaiA [Clostridia bacterium]